jgi:hypothetical protein
MQYDAKMTATVQSIFLQFFWLFLEHNPVPNFQIKAAEAIMKCRTSRLGGHRVKCLNGHKKGAAYNSCKHRACPKCSFIQIFRFIEEKQARLLNCGYYHCVFTIPQELNDLFRHNTKEMGDLLFKATHAVLSDFLLDDQHLGAKVGMMASLHTWGRNLSCHPHLHVLVTAGGMAPEGWRRFPKRNYFLPEAAVEVMFRKKYLCLLKRSLRDGTIQPPASSSLQHCLNRIETAFHLKWHFRYFGPYNHGRGVVEYLARYMRGGPIANSQLVDFNGSSITFTYKDTQSGELATLKLGVMEFIRRVLLHVPPHRMRTFRMYGLFHPHCQDQLNRARKLLGQKPYVPAEFTNWSDFLISKGFVARTLCDECGAPLCLAQRIAPSAVEIYPRAYKDAA